MVLSDSHAASPEEIRRTHPDRIVHDPTFGRRRPWSDPDFFWLNEQLLVLPTADGGLLATWTSERLSPHLLRVACSRSDDGGHTWTEACYLDGDGIDDGGPAAWQIPILSPSGRVYLLYTRDDVPGSGGFGGALCCRTSDTHGRDWSDPACPQLPRAPIDDPTGASPICVSVSVPLLDRLGRALISFTRWANNPDVPAGDVGIKERFSQIEIVRFDNLPDDPDAPNVRISALSAANPISVPHETVDGASFAQEPYMVRLPDTRLFMTMRTNRGRIWYAVSDDDGASWSDASLMRYRDGGEIVKQPVAPCPVYSLARGDYVLLFQNNDGFVFGAESRWDVRNRRPAYLSRGEYRPTAHQPIWWSEPKCLIDAGEAPWGPPGLGRLEAAAYPSMTEHAGRRTLWYPDRKGFLLGTFIEDAWLDDMSVPEHTI